MDNKKPSRIVIMNYKVGLITSNQLLIRQVKKIIKKFFPEMDLMIEDINEKAVEGVINKFSQWGSEAVLCSHTFTAEQIRQITKIAVILIPKQPLDILEALAKASKYQKTIGLSSYLKPPLQMKLIKNFINSEVKPIIFRNRKELGQKIIAVFEEGMEVIVGGVFTQEISKQYKRKSFLIQYGEDGLYDTLKYTQMIIETAREHEEKNKLINTIIEHDNRGVIVTDNRGRIIFINQYIENILDLPSGVNINGHVKSIITGCNIENFLQKKKSELVNIPALKEAPILINTVPIQMGGVPKGTLIYLRKLQDLQDEEIKTRRKTTSQSLEAKYTIDHFTSRSPAMQELIRRINRFAQLDTNILITGESGTGKEIVAHSLHNLGNRKGKPFVAINCSTLQETLLDSELFGYEEGSFTGAKKGGKLGLFELAHKGTIFLDEIGTLPISLQAKLLRVIQEKEIRRIGGEKNVPIDVRCIAATNAKLLEEINFDQFRSDLFYRLSVLNLHVPPLRQRLEDIPILIEVLINQFCREYKIEKMTVSTNLLERLKLYSWPGNVRELENYLRKYVLLTDSHENNEKCGLLLIEELENAYQTLIPSKTTSNFLVESKSLSERTILKEALEKFGGNRDKTAATLGISRSTLWRKMKQHNL